MSRKVTHMSLEGGCLFFEDGTEVSGVSVEMIKALPDLLKELEILLDSVEQRMDPMDYNRGEVLAAIAKAKGLT